MPTIGLDHLTPAQARTFLIADNHLTENSEWNDRLLAEAFPELSLLDLDFSPDVTESAQNRGPLAAAWVDGARRMDGPS